MKHLNLILLIFAVVICNAADAQKANADQVAIRKIIDAETRTFFEKKYDQWADTWAHDSTIFIIRAYPTYQTQIFGWNSISKQYKETMENFPVFTQDQITPYMNKTDYRFSINGNMARVSFKEGKNEKEATDETRILAKQNGSWKTIGMTVIGTGEYNLRNSLNNLKLLLGTWKTDSSSMKAEPAVKGNTNYEGTTDIHETENGVEMVTHQFSYANGQPTSSVEYEQLVPDYSTGEIKYIDILKYPDGYTTIRYGKAEVSDAGNLVVTVMDADKPAMKVNDFTLVLQPNGVLHGINKTYDKDGKVQAYIFDLHRL